MNIYVGNLPKTVSEDTIRQLFEAHGEVSEIKLIKDTYSGELKGFGFIQMPEKAAADAAIQNINGTELEGRKLIVNEARPRTDRPGGDRRGGGGGGGRRTRSW
jgi:RNA recognition motif-containing protein